MENLEHKILYEVFYSYINFRYLTDLFPNLCWSAEMHKVAPVGASHPLDLPHVRDFSTDQVSEYPDRHVGLERLVRIVLPVVHLENLLVIIRHPVGDQHDRLITSGTLSLGAERLEQLERDRQG